MTIKELPFFIISDIHGDESALNLVKQKLQTEEAQSLLICGDLCPNSPYFTMCLQNMPCPYYLVRGNCDSLWDFSEYNLALPPLTREIAFNERTIAMTHGHIYYVDNYPYSFKSCDIFIYGHTHVAEMIKGDETHPNILNPGSISRPRGTREGTFIKLYQERAELWSLSDKKLKSLLLAQS